MADDASAPRVVAVDLGGTKLAVADVAEDGTIRASTRRATAVIAGPDAVVAEIGDAFDALRAETGVADYAALGIGVAGQVQPGTGVVRYAPNLGWHDFPLRARVEARVGLPVTVLNDVQSAAYGESRYGAGKGVAEMVAIFVGTGVGGGVIHDGSLVLGCGGSAGEVGHITIDLDGPECRCGNRGCLESFVGGWAIALRAREAVAARPAEGRRLLELVEGDADRLTAEAVSTAAIEGDPLALEMVADVARLLGVGIATIANLYNPCLVVLGGGVMEGIPGLLERVESAVQERALRAAAEGMRVVAAGLGPWAGVVGAAAWARRSLDEDAGLAAP